MKLREFIEIQSKDSSEIKASVKEIREDLNYHIRRTDLIEAMQSSQEEDIKSNQEAIKPLTRRALIESALLKIGLTLVTIGAAIAGIYKIFM